MTRSFSQQLFALPPGASDWLRTEEMSSVWLDEDPSPAYEMVAWDALQQWDALVGRMFRAALFDETEEPRLLRKQAEAVAAVGESLAVRLGVER